MTVVGVSLLAAAAFAGSAPARHEAASPQRGGSLVITTRGDFCAVDPALAYCLNTWTMMAATSLTLMYYPHVEGAAGSRLTPMASQGMPRVANRGRTYTFTIRQGFRFNTGRPVTAANFARAFTRALSKDLQSPGALFLEDVVSYRAVGARTFRVVLKRNAPDFLARMSMPFFAAVPVAAPIARRGMKAPVVSAGPYYLKEWNERRSALVVRNPFWRNNRRPFALFGFNNHLDEIRWLVGFLPETQRLQCERGEADICSFPPAQANGLAEKYGINKGRFFVKRSTTVGYLAMNTSRPPFSNPDLRKAVAHAIDRRFMVAQHGFLAGEPTDQLLPYSMPGFTEANIYSLQGPNYAKAKRLARGKTGDGKAVLYSIIFHPGPAIAQSIQFNLRQIGLDVEVKVFSPHVAIAKAGTRGEPFDLVFTWWSMDYPDPSSYINVLLDGRRIQAESNLNLSYFDNAKMNRAMDRAYALSGQARLDAYADLDIALMRDHAPIAAYISTNARILTSAKVGCYAFSPIYQSLLTRICTT